MISTLFPSLIRTYVPIVVGAFISWILTLGVELDESTEAGLVTALTAILIAAYYTLVRLLEKKWPALSVLLGSTRIPAQYTPDGTVQAPQEPGNAGGALPPAGGMLEP